MQFVVPQFIEVEDKIIGPLSVRQFITFLAGFGFIFVGYKLLSFFVFILFALVVFGLTGIFAFAKVNGQLFHFFLLNILYSMKIPRLRIWKKDFSDLGKSGKKGIVPVKKSVYTAKKAITGSRLTQLSLVVDTGGSYKEEEDALIK